MKKPKRNMKNKTEWYLCHFDDGSGCWIKCWRGPTNYTQTHETYGSVWRHRPGVLCPPDPLLGSKEIRIPRRLARCLIRSWQRKNGDK